MDAFSLQVCDLLLLVWVIVFVFPDTQLCPYEFFRTLVSIIINLHSIIEIFFAIFLTVPPARIDPNYFVN